MRARFCRPSQQFGVGSTTEIGLMGSYDIEVRNAKQQAAKDDLIEILINEQPKYGRAIYLICFESPFS
jgi:hypothetical protein